ncbi:hypothetical protein QQX98_001264 [Neonectria punicea]|uniref:Azaphilone pigments biosynthesis cluster protein L N-terminal domain-containing protein n=1 Tax=Neonectria punicea TaxID=979145 RepID=A0ABR1HQ96_9HYPO
MEALGATSSVIAIATLAWQSSKAAFDIANGLVEAPIIMDDSKRRLLETQNVLDLLQTQLLSPTGSPQFLDSLLQKVKLDRSLQLTQALCDDFQVKLKGYTKHSSGSKFSNRHRLVVNFHESTIRRFNTELSNGCYGLTTVLTSLNLILSSQMSDNIDDLAESLATQVTALNTAGEQLAESQQALRVMSAEETTGGELSNSPIEEAPQLTTELEAVCKRTRDAVETRRTRQTFGIMQLDKSVGMQGIVGIAQQSVDQKFGDLKASNESRGFQGQMGSDSFDKLFK